MSRPDALAARDAWAEAVWSSDLPTPAKVVALAYADHARDGMTGVWVAGARLRERASLGRDASTRALKRLEADGWLVVVEKAAQHRSTRYLLAHPAQQSASRNAEGSASQNTDAHSSPSPGTLADASVPSPGASVPSPGASVPGDGNDLPPYLSPYLARATPAVDDPTADAPSQREEGGGDHLVVVEVAPLPDAPRGALTTEQLPVDPRRAPVEMAARTAGVAHDVLDDLVNLALADEQTHSPAGRLARDPNYVARLERTVRARRAEQRGAVVRAVTHHASTPCEHGHPGGDQLHPTSHLPICALCRAAVTRGFRSLAVTR